MQKLTEDNVKTFHPLALLIFLILLVFLGMIGFAGIGSLILSVVADISMEEFAGIMTDASSYPEYKYAILFYQGISAFGAFIVAPFFFANQFLKRKPGFFFPPPAEVIRPVLLVFFIMMSFMVVNSVVIEWNQNIEFPDSLSWFEEYAKNKENQLAELTEYLTAFESFGYFLTALIVIAVIPGIGEELLFRGLIQNLLKRWFKNPHAAIWLSALFFSAFHYQFYGLVPRMLLGALFGYLYWWSGSLPLTMLAHFINNAFMLTMLYLHQNGFVEYDIEGDQSTPGAATLIFFFILTTGLLWYFYRIFKNQENDRMAKGV